MCIRDSLRDFGALFGQRDIFMAAALGSVLLILAHRQNMAIAAMLFALGFLISMVGRQTSRGVARYTFEIEYLASGFNLIVVIVGIFALSQALNLMNGKDTDPPETKITKGLFKGLAELKNRVSRDGWAAGIALYPTSIESLMEVADAGEVMPPKSTWFEPKLKSGLVSHLLD